MIRKEREGHFSLITYKASSGVVRIITRNIISSRTIDLNHLIPRSLRHDLRLTTL